MKDCQRLVDVITARISQWTARFLSYVGRLQLINTVLFSRQSYWFSLFILPPTVYKLIEQIFAKFFRSGPSMDKRGAYIAWSQVTKPRKEGGLGIKKLSEWSRAAAMKHLWHLLTYGTGNMCRIGRENIC